MMESVVYDGSFEGWLTAVFEVFEHGFKDTQIITDKNFQQTIFGKEHRVFTDGAKAGRVWKGLRERVSTNAMQQLYQSWLSEIPGMDDTMLSYVQYAFSSKIPMETDFSSPVVRTIFETSKKVHREKHRMEAFVRFQLTSDGLYYAIVEPDFNVLPLLQKHFKNRYADQRWMIYDARRKYGIYYNLDKVDIVHVNFEPEWNGGKDISAVYDQQEELYQHLWKRYFSSVNIAARKNMKLHVQHMPMRYWKFLPEK
jgi:probable DNA metabolism protein